MWKFSKVQEIEKSCYESGTFNYRKQVELMREQVEMMTYLEYCIWKCDLVFDFWKIFYEVQAIYPEITEKQVREAIDREIAERRVLNQTSDFNG